MGLLSLIDVARLHDQLRAVAYTQEILRSSAILLLQRTLGADVFSVQAVT